MIELKNDTKTLVLRETLFWDVNGKAMDAQGSKSLIVERVISRGNMYEFRQLIRFYTLEELAQTVVKIGYLDGRTLNFISGYLNIPKEKFLCYRKRQSNPAHWNS